MDLALLQSFVAVADCGSFSGAALRMNLTQSTVSHQVARLEEYLGQRLFHRTTRKCTMTDAGRELRERALAVIDQIAEVERQFRPHSLRGRVRFGMPDESHLFPPLTAAITSFSQVHPNVEVEVTGDLSESLRSKIEDGRLDLAVLREVDPVDVKNCIRTDRLIWVASQSWKRPSGPLQLAMVPEPCLYRKAAQKILRDLNQEFKIVVSCTSLAAVLAIVRGDLAISMISQMDLPDDLVEPSDLAGLPPLPPIGFAMQYREGRRDVLARTLAQHVERGLRGLKAPAPRKR